MKKLLLLVVAFAMASILCTTLAATQSVTIALELIGHKLTIVCNGAMLAEYDALPDSFINVQRDAPEAFVINFLGPDGSPTSYTYAVRDGDTVMIGGKIADVAILSCVGELNFVLAEDSEIDRLNINAPVSVQAKGTLGQVTVTKAARLEIFSTVKTLAVLDGGAIITLGENCVIEQLSTVKNVAVSGSGTVRSFVKLGADKTRTNENDVPDNIGYPPEDIGVLDPDPPAPDIEEPEQPEIWNFEFTSVSVQDNSALTAIQGFLSKSTDQSSLDKIVCQADSEDVNTVKPVISIAINSSADDEDGLKTQYHSHIIDTYQSTTAEQQENNQQAYLHILTMLIIIDPVIFSSGCAPDGAWESANKYALVYQPSSATWNKYPLTAQTDANGNTGMGANIDIVTAETVWTYKTEGTKKKKEDISTTSYLTDAGDMSFSVQLGVEVNGSFITSQAQTVNIDGQQMSFEPSKGSDEFEVTVDGMEGRGDVVGLPGETDLEKERDRFGNVIPVEKGGTTISTSYENVGVDVIDSVEYTEAEPCEDAPEHGEAVVDGDRMELLADMLTSLE